MSLLDQVVGAVTSKIGGQTTGQKNMLDSVFGLINNQAGGLSGLVQAFKDKGLADVVSSWVGTGNNLPVTPSQLQSALGSSQIQDIAKKLGMSPEDASTHLAQVLPTIVDKLTPEGKIPSSDLLSQGMNLLKGVFSK